MSIVSAFTYYVNLNIMNKLHFYFFSKTLLFAGLLLFSCSKKDNGQEEPKTPTETKAVPPKPYPAPAPIINSFGTYYGQRQSLFELLPISSDDIVFLGNSITDGAEWGELFADIHVKNRGISGDITDGVLARLGNILRGKPKKIFLMIGTNDLALNIPVQTVEGKIKNIIQKIKTDSPSTKLYIQSVLPTNHSFGLFSGHMKHTSIAALNEKIKVLCQENGLTYIDLYKELVTSGSQLLDPAYTNDGLHLVGATYFKWRDFVLPFVKE